MAGILLAEDDATLRNFLARALGRVGHVVTACEDGSEAIATLEQREYEVLLVDISMPEVDGAEVAQYAVAHSPGIKVLFITGFAGLALSLERTGMNQGARVLPKPFHLRNLVDQIDVVLREAA